MSHRADRQPVSEPRWKVIQWPLVGGAQDSRISRVANYLSYPQLGTVLAMSEDIRGCHNLEEGCN